MTRILLLALAIIASAAPRAEAMDQDSDVIVREQDGTYHVAATFSVAQREVW
jgi:hypothetical protein